MHVALFPIAGISFEKQPGKEQPGRVRVGTNSDNVTDLAVRFGGRGNEADFLGKLLVNCISYSLTRKIYSLFLIYLMKIFLMKKTLDKLSRSSIRICVKSVFWKKY